MSDLIDQSERHRFEHGHDINISVIAPAGVGKTTAIVNRIVQLARLPESRAVERLSRLVVVTYSVRAAQQMQQRARAAISSERLSGNVQRAFQQTIFGTIHSFCVRLLDRFGHYLGLPSPVGLLQDEEEIWNHFLLRGVSAELDHDPHLRELLHFYSPVQLYRLGRIVSPGKEFATLPLPKPDVQRLLSFAGEGMKGPTKTSIIRAQEKTRQWLEAWKRGEYFRSLPPYPPSPLAASYAEVWRMTFAPLHAWMHDTALAFGRRVANDYERFRLAEAVMTYDDQVRLALRVLDHPAARRELAEDRYSVLLDEAQDTDPLQFAVLRRVAGLGEGIEQADDQNFSIVGDFQQAIYAPRSDLPTYQDVHDKIRIGARGSTSQLQVTFRCDTAIIQFVNNVFPSILNNLAGQSDFVKLVPRTKAGPGQVVRMVCPDLPEPKEDARIKSARLYQHEAEFVAEQIHRLGCAGLGAQNWSQVALLCPRKNWLLDLRHALVARGLRVQLHSSDEAPRDRMPGAWLTALLWVASHPEDTFEIAGVLREVFGVSDNDMALYTEGDGEKLNLHRPVPRGDGSVQTPLRTLQEACADADARPLHLTVGHIVTQTHLRERLHSIPDADVEDIDRELDEFLAIINARSAEGLTLADLAHDLRTGLTQPDAAGEEIHHDAIQMMTSHKSKGLEWEAVIVPYLFRRIEWKSAEYPRLVFLGANDAIICRDKAEYQERAQAVVDLRERQQCQRLYYVMCTRAKRTLLLIDDEAAMARQIPNRAGEIAGNFLQFTGGPNREFFHSLPDTLSLAPEKSPLAPAQDIDLPNLPPLTTVEVAQAVASANYFPRRTTPHALAIHTRDEAEPEKQTEREDDQLTGQADGPGILYGIWWHEFVQKIPWNQPATAWSRVFEESQPHSPQPERAALEWDLFRRSPLAQWLAEPGRLIQVELPFLWRNGNDETCLEGVMDLAVYVASESTWYVIDWKTNQPGTSGSGGVVEVYRGQIEAYARALREMLSAEVRGSLYLTRTGEWLPVE